MDDRSRGRVGPDAAVENDLAFHRPVFRLGAAFDRRPPEVVVAMDRADDAPFDLAHGDADLGRKLKRTEARIGRVMSEDDLEFARGGHAGEWILSRKQGQESVSRELAYEPTPVVDNLYDGYEDSIEQNVESFRPFLALLHEAFGHGGKTGDVHEERGGLHGAPVFVGAQAVLDKTRDQVFHRSENFGSITRGPGGGTASNGMK